ncbi:MAG: VCBS repeat-containing protein [Deltaproteobacteria bacterium]|nr:VCBS repeat-containing protein [Candidatus Tharpella sp.]
MTKNKSQLSIIIIFLITTFFLAGTPLYATVSQWQPLAQTIQNRLNPGNRAVANVSMVQGSTVIITLFNSQIPIGMTLAVKGNSLPGVALALQNNIAQIKITQINGNQARGTILNISGKIPTGAPLFPLAHNRVYLYTNLKSPQNLLPYQDLTRTLQYNKIPYAIKSGSLIAAGDTPGIRPLIIAFEAERNLITCRLTDREQNIFWHNNFSLNFAPPITCQAGANWTQPTAFSNAPSGSVGGNQSFTKATGPAPGTQAAGKIDLRTPYKRLIFADCDGKPGKELVLLNKNYLETYHLNNLKLTPLARYRLPHKSIIPLHLHAGDFNHNGKDELYVTLARPIIVEEKNDTQLSSIIVEFNGKAPKLLGQDYPYYFRVIEQRDGNQVLMAQKMGRFNQYEVPIRWGGFYNGKFKIKKEYSKSRDVFSLYNFNLSPFNKNHLLIIDEEGNVAGFDGKTSEKLITSDTQYGIFDESPYNQKLKDIEYEGGFTVKKTAVIRLSARRFVKRSSYGNQIFLIKKRRVVDSNLFEKGLDLIVDEAVKHDQIIGLQWREGEIRETWKSPKFPRDIVDFGFTKENGTEMLVVLTRNKDGKYALELLR